MNREIIEEFKRRCPSYSIIFMSKSGSTLHGTKTENSDVDVRGIFVADVESMLLQKQENNIFFSLEIEECKVEVTLQSLREFLLKVKRMECNALELLFSFDNLDMRVASSAHGAFVFNEAKKLLSNDFESFYGMAAAEIKRYKNGPSKRNLGKDIAHGFRALYEAQELKTLGKITFPLLQADKLVALKKAGTVSEIEMQEFLDLFQKMDDDDRNVGIFIDQTEEEKFQLIENTILTVYRNI